MTKHEADVIGGLNMTDQISNEAYKQIIIAAQDENEPCEDCISRQAAIDTIESWLSCDDYNEAERHIMRAMQSVLYDLPFVNPEKPICPSAGIDCEDCPTYEPKTGHWIFDEVLDRHYYCSECKSMGVDYWDYCPNCGAKMTERGNKE